MESRFSSNGDGQQRMDDERQALIQTELNPLVLAQLQALQGRTVQGLALWQDSIADEEVEEGISEEDRVFVDFDLYLEGRDLLEIYAATVYSGFDDEPMAGLDEIAQALGEMTGRGAILSEVTTDDEEGLVLIFATEDDESLIIAPSGWVLGHWDELPEEEEYS